MIFAARPTTGSMASTPNRRTTAHRTSVVPSTNGASTGATTSASPDATQAIQMTVATTAAAPPMTTPIVDPPRKTAVTPKAAGGIANAHNPTGPSPGRASPQCHTTIVAAVSSAVKTAAVGAVHSMLIATSAIASATPTSPSGRRPGCFQKSSPSASNVHAEAHTVTIAAADS